MRRSGRPRSRSRNSAPFSLSLVQLAPVLFSADGTGQGNVLASHADGAAVSNSSPANAGEVIAIFGIGMGPTVYHRAHRFRLTLYAYCFYYDRRANNDSRQSTGGLFFAGLAPGKVGVYQLNFVMPPDITTGVQPINVTIGGVSSNILTLPTSDAPVISGLQNNYSYITPGLPNYGIAQGAIFAIYGANLAKSSIPLQTSYPLQTSLAGFPSALPSMEQPLIRFCTTPVRLSWLDLCPRILQSGRPNHRDDKRTTRTPGRDTGGSKRLRSPSVESGTRRGGARRQLQISRPHEFRSFGRIRELLGVRPGACVRRRKQIPPLR